MRQFFSIVFFSFWSIVSMMGQSISGKVVDEKNHPLPYVSVILQNVQDSSYINGVATNIDGIFSIPVMPHFDYNLLISYLGYETIHVFCKVGNIGTIVMKEDAMMIDRIRVVASRTQHHANGYTVNLRSSEVAKGKQSSDALAFLPGISNEEGNYKIHGLPVSEIFIDGVKIMSFDELKNLPADMMDKVKVNYLAGSNQNAAMAGGTIEIELRRPPQGGYHGSLTGGSTLYPAYGFSNENVGGVICYRYKNFSFYDNLSMDLHQPEETAEQMICASEDLRMEIKEKTKHRGSTFNNRLSLSRQINAKNTIGGSWYIATNKLNTNSTTMERNENAIPSELDGRIKSFDQEATWKYTSILSQRGTALDIIGDYLHRQSGSRSYYSYGYNTSSMSEDASSSHMYKLSVDLTDPHRKMVWKYGASVQYMTSDYTPQPRPVDSPDRFRTSLIPTRTSGLTPLAYISATGQIWNIHYSVGVNWQLNKIEYETKDDGAKSSDMQRGIHPAIQLMMPLDKNGKHTFMLNYKCTLDDIPYAAISSTIRWSDPYNYTTGNPDLKSPTAHVVATGVSLFRNIVSFTAIYIHAKDNIYWETMQSPTASDVFYTTPINLSPADMFGVGAEVNWNPVQSWIMKLSGRLEIHPENMTLGGIHYGETRLRPYCTMHNTFRFKQGWGGMMNLMYEPTYKTYDRTYHAVYHVGGQIYKKMCKDKLQLTLTFLALGKRRKYDRYTDGKTVTYNYTSPMQNIGIALAWRFSGGKSVSVNAVENGAQVFKDVKDIR